MMASFHCYNSIFLKSVYYKVDDSYFPPHSTEKRGFWVGIDQYVIHAMTFKVITDENQQILFHSNTCFSEEPM